MIHSPRALFFFFFFLKWRSACDHQIHFSGQDQSSVAQGPETTVAECNPADKSRLSSFSLIGSHTLRGQHNKPTPTSLGQGWMRVQV